MEGVKLSNCRVVELCFCIIKMDHLLVVPFIRYSQSLLVGFKVLLAYEAYGAGPVVGEFLKGCSWRNVMFRVAHVRVIFPVAYGTSILLHGVVGS